LRHFFVLCTNAIRNNKIEQEGFEMNDTLNIKSGKATLKLIFEEPLESVISRETNTFDNLAAPF
jgi:hypothetical protein